jgi:hypothetical protein
MHIDKQFVAREWLVLFFSILLGFVVTPLLFFHSYEYGPRYLSLDQKLSLMSREQKIEAVQERRRVLDSIKHNSHFDPTTARPVQEDKWSKYIASTEPRQEQFDPDAYLLEKSTEEQQFDLNGFLRDRGLGVGKVSAWEQFVTNLFSWKYSIETWASIFTIYAIVMVTRSLLWSTKTLLRNH